MYLLLGTDNSLPNISTVPEVLLQVRSQAALWALALGWDKPADAVFVTYALPGWGTEPIYVGTLEVPGPVNNNVYMSDNIQT